MRLRGPSCKRREDDWLSQQIHSLFEREVRTELPQTGVEDHRLSLSRDATARIEVAYRRWSTRDGWRRSSGGGVLSEVLDQQRLRQD